MTMESGQTPTTPPASGSVANPTPGAGDAPVTPPAGGAPATPPAGGAPQIPPAGAPATPPAAFDWASAVKNPDLLRAEVMNGIDSPEALIERAIKLDGQLKAEGRVKIPGEGATPEEVAAFRKAIGVPDEGTASAYDFKDPGFDPNSGVTFDQGMSDWAAKVFHEAGVPKSMAKGIFDAWNQKITADVAAENERVANMGRETEAALRREFGQTYETAMGEMRQAVRAIFGDAAGDIEAMLSMPAVGNDPKIMRGLMNLRKFYAEAKGEEAFKRPATGPSSLGLTPAEAKAQIDAITRDRTSPYWSKDHPEHAATVQKVNQLYEAMNPPIGGE